MDDSDDFLETFRVVPGSFTAAVKAKRRQNFIRFPYRWFEVLQKERSGRVYRVALFLLYRNWRNQGRPIPLSNLLLADVGVARREKWRALANLERLGLVKVERRKRKAPLVTVFADRS
jgi:hypothetical protein